MWSNAREIAEGDLVIVWLTRESLQAILITPGKELNGRFGVYSHSDLIGVPYGSKVSSRNGKGFIHVLRPTPELWTLALPHRTQILYSADIALITSWLAVKPGSVVAEAGTGSASFSHSLARTIGPKGHLYTYEFHQVRASKAREEFIAHGMGDRITLTHRNVCKDGFGLSDVVDSVFLDLPAPWEAIPHAKTALRKDQISRICCFSPCIEQVLRTVSALNEAGFTGITMYETLVRPYELSLSSVAQILPIDIIAEKLKRGEVKKEERRLRQIEQSKAVGARKRKREEEQGLAQADGNLDVGVDGDREEKGRKKVRIDDADRSSQVEITASTPAQQEVSGNFQEDLQMLPVARTPSPPPPMTLIKPISEVRGHTSYLTFACLLPLPSEGANPVAEVIAERKPVEPKPSPSV